MRKGRWMSGVLGGVLLAAAVCVAWGMGRPHPQPVAVEARAPSIRLVDEQGDAQMLTRIEELRAKLPGRHARRHNFAWARAEVEGLEKREYYSHSGIQRLAQFSAEVRREISDISVRPKQWRFVVLCVNHDDVVNGPNCFYRNSDTERKILEEMAGRLPDESVSGHIVLYTDLYPCASCRNIMVQFLAVYTNITMEVLYRER